MQDTSCAANSDLGSIDLSCRSNRWRPSTDIIKIKLPQLQLHTIIMSQSINLYPDSVHKSLLGDPEYYPEIDTYVETIRNATKGFGTDEDALIQTLGSKDIHERYLIAYRYKETYNQDLKDLMNKETSGNFGVLIKLLALPIPDAEAKIINMATKGMGTNERLLWSVICGRSNEEIEILKKAYFKKYNKDISFLVASELSGALKKLRLACLQAMEETYDPTYHNKSKAAEDADAGPSEVSSIFK